jgi:hypothetical protein
VNAPLVVIGSELIQLAMQVEAVPEERVVEILAPKRSDQPLDERMRARHEGDGLEFLDVENSQIRPPAMKPEQWVMIGTEALGKWLSASGPVEHAADADAVDMRGFDTESDDTTRKHVHHYHHPEALQQDGFASKEIDAPQAVAGFSDGREPRRTFASRLWERVVRQNPAHHVLIDFQAECVRNLLGDAGAAEARIEALDLEDCGNQFFGAATDSVDGLKCVNGPGMA